MPLGNPAAAAAQPAGLHLGDDLVGRQRLQAAAQGDEAVVPQVLVQVERVELSAVLGGQVLLPAEEGADHRVAYVQRVPPNPLALQFVGEQAIEQAADGPPQASQQAGRLEVPQHEVRRVLGANPGVQLRRPLRRDDLHHRRLVTHARAADALDDRVHPRLRQQPVHGRVDLITPLGLAARPHADADLAQRRVCRHGRPPQ